MENTLPELAICYNKEGHVQAELIVLLQKTALRSILRVLLYLFIALDGSRLGPSQCESIDYWAK